MASRYETSYHSQPSFEAYGDGWSQVERSDGPNLNKPGYTLLNGKIVSDLRAERMYTLMPELLEEQQTDHHSRVADVVQTFEHDYMKKLNIMVAMFHTCFDMTRSFDDPVNVVLMTKFNVCFDFFVQQSHIEVVNLFLNGLEVPETFGVLLIEIDRRAKACANLEYSFYPNKNYLKVDGYVTNKRTHELRGKEANVTIYDLMLSFHKAEILEHILSLSNFNFLVGTSYKPADIPSPTTSDARHTVKGGMLGMARGMARGVLGRDSSEREMTAAEEEEALRKEREKDFVMQGSQPPVKDIEGLIDNDETLDIDELEDEYDGKGYLPGARAPMYVTTDNQVYGLHGDHFYAETLLNHQKVKRYLYHQVDGVTQEGFKDFNIYANRGNNKWSRAVVGDNLKDDEQYDERMIKLIEESNERVYRNQSKLGVDISRGILTDEQYRKEMNVMLHEERDKLYEEFEKYRNRHEENPGTAQSNNVGAEQNRLRRIMNSIRSIIGSRYFWATAAAAWAGSAYGISSLTQSDPFHAALAPLNYWMAMLQTSVGDYYGMNVNPGDIDNLIDKDAIKNMTGEFQYILGNATNETQREILFQNQENFFKKYGLTLKDLEDGLVGSRLPAEAWSDAQSDAVRNQYASIFETSGIFNGLLGYMALFMGEAVHLEETTRLQWWLTEVNDMNALSISLNQNVQKILREFYGSTSKGTLTEIAKAVYDRVVDDQALVTTGVNPNGQTLGSIAMSFFDQSNLRTAPHVITLVNLLGGPNMKVLSMAGITGAMWYSMYQESNTHQIRVARRDRPSKEDGTLKITAKIIRDALKGQLEGYLPSFESPSYQNYQETLVRRIINAGKKLDKKERALHFYMANVLEAARQNENFYRSWGKALIADPLIDMANYLVFERMNIPIAADDAMNLATSVEWDLNSAFRYLHYLRNDVYAHVPQSAQPTGIYGNIADYAENKHYYKAIQTIFLTMDRFEKEMNSKLQALRAKHTTHMVPHRAKHTTHMVPNKEELETFDEVSDIYNKHADDMLKLLYKKHVTERKAERGYFDYFNSEEPKPEPLDEEKLKSIMARYNLPWFFPEYAVEVKESPETSNTWYGIFKKAVNKFSSGVTSRLSDLRSQLYDEVRDEPGGIELVNALIPAET